MLDFLFSVLWDELTIYILIIAPEQIGCKAGTLPVHLCWERARILPLARSRSAILAKMESTTRIYARIVDKMTENPARYLEAMLTT